MEASNGTGSLDLPTGRWLLRPSPGRADSLSAKAAIHQMEKRLRLWEWQVGFVLEGFEKLNATLAEIEREGATR